MGHRVKNLFAITDGMIRMTARGASTKEELAEKLSSRLHALAAANSLVRRRLNDEGKAKEQSSLAEVVSAVLAPYQKKATEYVGPRVQLSERSTNSVALIFHELATNAAKYGALSRDEGVVDVTWKIENGNVLIVWGETGGPNASAPEKLGFGSTLVQNTVRRIGGEINSVWDPAGLQVQITFPAETLAS